MVPTRRLRAGLVALGVLSAFPCVLRAHGPPPPVAGCQTYIRITQAPPDPSYSTTASFRVEWGEDQTTPPCLSTGHPGGGSFQFTVNGVDRTAYFTNFGSYATATAVPLTDASANNYQATVQGHDANGVSRDDVASGYTYVNTKPAAQVYASLNNFDNQKLSACAVDCFAAVQRLSTVPYYSLDTPRNVTLVYHQDRVAPRPFVYASVLHPSGASNTPTEFRLQVKFNGAFVTFLNGEQTLRFTGSRSAVRLGGQFDASSYGTEVYAVDLLVTSVYSDGSTAPATTSGTMMVVNESQSKVARGWTIAGVHRLYALTNGSAVITEGDGSAVYYKINCGTCAPASFTGPGGEYSLLTRTGSGTAVVYTRAYPDSTKVRYDYLGQMTSITDRFGNAVTYGYDASGRLTRIDDPYRTFSSAKSYISLAYGTYGLTQIREPGADGSQTGGRVSYVRVNTDSTLRAFVDADGDSTRFAWASGTRLLSAVTDRGGSVTTYGYHAVSQKVVSLTLPAVPVDAGNGGTLSPVSPIIQLSPWQLEGVPQGATATTAASPVLTDSVRGSVTDADNHTTRFTINHRYGAPARVTDAAGRVTSFSYQEHLVTGVRHPTGELDSYTYSTNGLPTGGTPAGDQTVVITNGAYGQPQRVTRNGVEVQYAYLGTGGRADSVRLGGSGSISVIRNTFDTRGRLLVSKDPLSHASRYNYDARFGNMDSTLVSGNRYTRVRFDRFGRDSAASATAQPWQRTLYDNLNRPVELFDGVNASPTRYGYDKLLLTRVQDPKGQVYRFERNALGWVTRQYDPADTLGRYTSSRYNKAGSLTSLTNRRGQVIDLRYDAAHRIVSKTGVNVVADSFSYSADSRRVVAWNAVSRDEVSLSAAGWTDSVVTEIAGKRFRMQYVKHAAVPVVASFNVASNSGITFATQGVGRAGSLLLPDTLRVNGQATKTVRNADLDPVRAEWPTGVTRTDSLTNLHATFKSAYSSASVNLELWRGYQYDVLNRVAEAISLNYLSQPVVRQYGYDDLGRLRSGHTLSYASCPAADTINGYNCMPDGTAPSTVYSYDPAGNRTDPLSATYTAGNRLVRVDYRSFEHDLDGNMTRQYDNDGGPANTRYYWSADGRLDSVLVGTTRLRYEYNALGRLVRKSRNGAVERHLLWDRDHLLAELNATATGRVAEYAYAPGTDRPFALVTGATTPALVRYFAQDELGRVIGVINGTAVDQQIAYGDNDWGTASPIGTLGDTSRLQWKGLPYDRDVQLYYVRNRWYEGGPLVGRFISEDPIGLEGGLNLYAFANSDPINGWDPLGLDPNCTPTAERRCPLAPVNITAKRDEPDPNQMSLRRIQNILDLVKGANVVSPYPKYGGNGAAGSATRAQSTMNQVGNMMAPLRTNTKEEFSRCMAQTGIPAAVAATLAGTRALMAAGAQNTGFTSAVSGRTVAGAVASETAMLTTATYVGVGVTGLGLGIAAGCGTYGR